MSDDGSALRQFLIDYKKRLPVDEDSKDFHEHIDFMIKYFETSHSYYREDWGKDISPNDEKYWRRPKESEKVVIKIEQKEKEVERKKEEPRFAITVPSLILALIGCIVVSGFVLLKNGDVGLIGLTFYGVFVLQGFLTIFYELGIIPFSIWGWLY